MGDCLVCPPNCPWGNLTNKNLITGKGGENLQVNASTKNQLFGFQYDIAGNMLTDNLNNSYVYDAENRIISAGGMSYLYDGDGNRVEKCTAGTTAGTCASGATGTLYWRGKDSEVLNESDLGVTAWKRFVFFNGRLVARRDSASGNTYYFYSDHLGSVGVVTDVTGHTIETESDYYPYGGERVVTSALSDEHYKFTGKERDGETGLDYFGARYYASNMGRWMSPDWSVDPSAIPYADIGHPQSLNLYSYSGNSPLSNSDDDGHDCIYNNGDGTGYVLRGDCASDTDSGVYVNGTVDMDSFHYNPSNNSSRFTYTPDGAAPGTVGVGVLQGPDLNGGFEPGSLAAGVFGAGSASTWRNAAGAANTLGMIEANIMAPWAVAAVQCSGQSKGACAGNMALALFPFGLEGVAAKELKAIAGVLKMIDSGTTKGKVFLNLEGKLPAAVEGYYREFTVPLAGQTGRGASRIVTGASGEAYYTADHYATFMRIR